MKCEVCGVNTPVKCSNCNKALCSSHWHVKDGKHTCYVAPHKEEIKELLEKCAVEILEASGLMSVGHITSRYADNILKLVKGG